MTTASPGSMSPSSIKRIESLRTAMNRLELDALLVTRPENRRYLSGFTGSAGCLLITGDSALILVDSRYYQQAHEECPDFRVVKYEVLIESIVEMARELDIDRIGFESAHVSFKDYRTWTEKGADIAWEPVGPVVEELRSIKGDEELARMQAAARIADNAFTYILGLVKPGVQERDLAVELEYHLKKTGSDGVAFETIIAFGERAALPHASPTSRRLKPGEMVLFDFGAVVDGYCSDMTRTVCLGKADARLREIYELVLKAQEAGLDAIRDGAAAVAVDKAARDVIEAAGFGGNFGHGLGHGVGLAVHEDPRLSPRSEAQLCSGMVVTDEPGIYIEGWGGVRIEDMVVVEKDGGRVLTGSEHGLIEL